MHQLMLDHTRMFGDMAGGIQFSPVALPVIEAKRVANIALLFGQGEKGGGIEPAGKKYDRFFHSHTLAWAGCGLDNQPRPPHVFKNS